jgi:hypothetical protein
MLVQLWVYQEGRRNPKPGSGFVVGITDKLVFIATAGHVVLSRDAGGVQDTLTVRVAFRSDSLTGISEPETLPLATVYRAVDNDSLDLAVLIVLTSNIRSSEFDVESLSFDRIGGVGDGDRVYPIGCGLRGFGCWATPALPEVVHLREGHLISYQTQVTSKGHSGGALFNRWGEIVGMIIEVERNIGIAQDIDLVVDSLKKWVRPVRLGKSRVPRAGPRWTVELAHLWPIDENRFFSPEGLSLGETREQLPAVSGRIALSRRLYASKHLLVYGHFAGLRLAPKNLTIGGGFVGLQALLRFGRVGIGGFGEVGGAHVESQFDAVGHYVASASGADNRYVPLWNRVEDDVLGAGFGGRLEITILRFLILQGTIGTWALPMPENSQDLPPFVVGAGMRIGG